MLNSPLINLLAECVYEANATCRYDIMAGGLIWDDETPKASDYGANLRAEIYLRKVIAYRASLTMGQARTELEDNWNELKQLAPNWPGFRAERMGRDAQRLLKIHQYKAGKLLKQALDTLDADL